MIYRLSSYGENDTYCLHTAGVTGSSPVSPTIPYIFFLNIHSGHLCKIRSKASSDQPHFKILVIVACTGKIGQPVYSGFSCHAWR